MPVQSGDVVIHPFQTYDRNGVGADFDGSPAAAPTAVLRRNGTDTAIVVAIDSLGTVDAANGEHTISFTVPSGYTSGDRLTVIVTGTVDGAKAPVTAWEDTYGPDPLTAAELAAELTNATIEIVGVYSAGGDITIVQGDDYTSAFAVAFTLPATAPDLTGADLAWVLQSGAAVVSVEATCSNPGDAAQSVPFNPSKTDTADLPPNNGGAYQLQATYPGTLPRTVAGGRLVIKKKLTVPA